MTGVFCFAKDKDRKLSFNVECIAEIPCFVVRVYREEQNTFSVKRRINKALKLFKKYGIYRIICPEDDYVIEKMRAHNLTSCDITCAKQTLAYDMFIKICKDDYVPLIYAKKNSKSILELLYKLSNLKHVRIMIGSIEESENIRGHILEKFGLSVITNREKPDFKICMICFDIPNEKMLDYFMPCKIINVSGHKIMEREEVYSQVDILSKEIDIPDGTNSSVLLLHLIAINPAYASKCKIYKIYS